MELLGWMGRAAGPRVVGHLAWQHLTARPLSVGHCILGVCLAYVWDVFAHTCDSGEISVLQVSPL